MDLIWDGVREAVQLLIGGDAAVYDAAMRSLWISSLAVLLATITALPCGILLGRRRFRGRRAIVLLCRVGMSFPTVFVGLVCFALFSRRGPIGDLQLLYTPWVIVCGEFLLAFPIIASLSQGAIRSLDPRVGETAWTLGAGLGRRLMTYVSEARVGIMLAVLTAFARCITELGIAMMVGGNLSGRTRTLATATALETGQGDFGRGVAMSLILLVVAAIVTLMIITLSREDEDTEW